ncbi:hypothetical protein AFR_42785 [Actinoplanes friuliensis DSM 7358]|uniref:Uncharacterized protein n=1 Tax=Actinoplanes friuliensis DSM 7358 TaxID=1246995 RepID=U5WFU6_9ACTN|nr:hypothetical protein AFR_42785 [Actinoplanes friuliensis DSM 7358]
MLAMREPTFLYRAFLEAKGSPEVTSLIAYSMPHQEPLRAVVWHATREEWIYAPATAARLLFSDEYADESMEVDRMTAESMARQYLQSELPSPEKLMEMSDEGIRMGWDYGPPPRE